MRYFFYIIIITGFLFFPRNVLSQERRNYRPFVSDTNIVIRHVDPIEIQDSEGTIRFYDSLKSKTSKNRFSKMLHKTLFRKPKNDTIYSGRFIDETAFYKQYQGKIIRDIRINAEDIFDERTDGIDRVIDKLHLVTREKVVRRDLLFKSGDQLDANQIVTNKQLLLSRYYLLRADIFVIPDAEDSTYVDLLVRTKDRWSISIDGSLRKYDKATFEVFDENILGTGNKFSVKTNFNRKNFKYHGNVFEYEIPNVLGSFYHTKITAGRDFRDRILEGSIQKDFINPTDYMVGAAYKHDKMEYYMLYADSLDLIKYDQINVWGGKSFYYKGINSSLYITGHYGRSRFPERPSTTTPTFNPAFHDYDNIFFGLGLYKERFYSANMIYGYGNKEYLPAGYNVELIWGYSWGEYTNDYYFGTKFLKGGFTNFGFLRGGLELGTYMDHKTGDWRRSALDMHVHWFSNLYRFRMSNIRQFLTLSHTRGWNREKVITKFWSLQVIMVPGQ